MFDVTENFFEYKNLEIEFMDWMFWNFIKSIL